MFQAAAGPVDSLAAVLCSQASCNQELLQGFSLPYTSHVRKL